MVDATAVRHRYTLRVSQGAAGEYTIFGSDSEARRNRVADQEVERRTGLPSSCKLRLYDRDELTMEILL